MKIRPFRCKTCGSPIGWNDKGCDVCGHLVSFDAKKRLIIIGGIIAIIIFTAALILCLIMTGRSA